MDSPDQLSATSNTTSTCRRPFVIIESIHIAGFELRTRTSPATHRSADYYVYEIVLANEAVGRWTVWRRFSDFVRLKTDIDKWAELRVKLAGSGCSLPPRLALNSILGIFRRNGGEAAKKREEELAAYRAEHLQNDFLIPMLAAVGGSDGDFWHHPAIIAFFEVPILRRSVIPPSSSAENMDDAGGMLISEDAWMDEFRKAEEVVDKASKLVQRQRKALARAHDEAVFIEQAAMAIEPRRRAITAAHTSRVIDGARKKIDELEASLSALPPQRRKTVEADIHRRALNKLKMQLIAAINELPVAHSAPSHRHDSRVSGGAEESPPVQLDPAPSPNTGSPHLHAAPSPLHSLPPTQRDVFSRQTTALAAQDHHLSQISLALRRQQILGTAINESIEHEKAGLDALHGHLNATSDKLAKGVDKAERL